MRVLILGGDGYLGWPTAMHLSAAGHSVAVLDNGGKRQWERDLGIEPLMHICSLQERADVWKSLSGDSIRIFDADLREYEQVESTFRDFKPEAIVHYGEQPSAGFSMMDHGRAAMTQTNNVIGTLNVLWAMRYTVPEAHLVKLGTMGEYGTPNIDIEEGYIEIEHKGRRDTLPFPKQPGSFYHLSKAHDSLNIHFTCRVWKLAATNLNQGVVYGIDTDETVRDARLATSFHYDEIFGTVLNRFCVEAVAGIPLTVYGKGLQKRGFLNIRDTLQCVKLSIESPAKPGEYRVFNQFTEVFSVNDLAELVARQSSSLGIKTEVRKIENPRLEAEDHYYNPVHSRLTQLGLKPRLLSDELVESMIKTIQSHSTRVKPDHVLPSVRWAGK